MSIAKIAVRLSDYGSLVPFTSGIMGASGKLDVADPSASGGVLLPVSEGVSVSSGIVANFFKTCFNAGRRIGLLRK
jgi:hypothetical protein